MEGKSGMGKGVSVARSMWGARQDAKTAGEKALATRSRSEMKERLERARMATESDNS
jgi:type IV secretion system protein TrbL